MYRFETPLLTACRLGDLPLVHLLLDFGADLNVTDFYGHTPLWEAVKGRRYDIARLLVSKHYSLFISIEFGNAYFFNRFLKEVPRIKNKL